MPRVEIDETGTYYRGSTGNTTFRRLGDQCIVQSKVRKRGRRPPTPRQAAHQDRICEMGEYGGWARKDPSVRPYYEAKSAAATKKLSVTSLANQDFWYVPVVDAIDLSGYGGRTGDVIAIAASDDTGVVGVEVRLMKKNGTVIEEGPAQLDENGWWLYAVTTRVRKGTTVHVEARAWDVPRVELNASHVGGDPGIGTAEIVATPITSRRGRRRGPLPPSGGTWRKDEGLQGTGRRPLPALPSESDVSVSVATESAATEVDALADESISLPLTALLNPAGLLQDARTRAGLSQRELARRAGMSQSAVSRIEKGAASPTVDTLLQLLRSAGFDAVAGLIGRTDEAGY